MLAGIKSIMLAAWQVVAETEATVEVTPEDQIWEVVASWQAYTACALLAGGIIFAIYGWRISKVLAVINFGIIGGFVGHYLAGLLELNDIASTVGLAVALGGLCIWQTRHGVSLMAGGAGAILGTALCYSLNLANAKPWIWAGLLLGFVTFALLAFIVYKVAAVLYSSVEGSALMVAGGLSLLSTQASVAEKLPELLRNHIYLLPIMLWIPTTVSIVVQQMKLKRHPSWAIDE